MALGGYKFAGYKCTKGSSMTDAEWALLIHKTRIKAFLEANTLAGTGWVFDLTQGELDYETGDNAIYDLGGDGLNLVSYFRNGTYPNAKYYMIASLFNWTCGSETAPQIRVSNTGPIVLGNYSSSNQYIITNQTLFHTVSYEPFPEDCLLSSSNNYPQKALALVPIFGWAISSQSIPNSTPSSTLTALKTSTLYLGYAMKGLDIISFVTFDDKMTQSDGFTYLRSTIVGFDSLALSSPGDSANIYGITVCPPPSYEQETRPRSWSGDALSFYNETLTDSFNRYSSPYSHRLCLSVANKAFFNGNTQSYPFETVTLSTYGDRNIQPFINSDGITSKGTFNIELLSCNGTYDWNGFTVWGAVANGNYITAVYCRKTASLLSSQTTYYVGWDASNPNILDESSWTEFVG